MDAMAEKHSLILASASAARRAMLHNAGLAFDVIPARLDEEAIARDIGAQSTADAPVRIAVTLAAEKARQVSGGHKGRIVIGADQVLALVDAVHSKVSSIEEARAVLQRLRGQEHRLISAVAVARDGEVLWQSADTARLTMRMFSDAFLDTYLRDAGPAILECVGCYQLEGLGAQLFDAVDGDYFTILGLPLVPLLARLRALGVIAS